MNVYAVASHHHVLRAWAEVRRRVPASPNLITFDFHTDTLEPFLRHVSLQFEGTEDESAAESAARMALVMRIQVQDEGSVESAIQLLNNDEHIQAATHSGILNLAFVNSFDGVATESEEEKQYSGDSICVARRYKNGNHSVPPRPHHYAIGEGRYFILPHVGRTGCVERTQNGGGSCTVDNQVLESVCLKEQLDWAQEIAASLGIPNLFTEPYILDLDLDFFHTLKSLSPDDPNLFHDLIRGALAITIATEPDWTEQCWIDPDPPEIEEMLERLYEHVREAMASAP